MQTLIVFIIVLGILVFVHELGHFLAAKYFKVRVDEFSIGFPPRLFKIKKGGTLYSINLIPLGGYVKIKGEGGEDKEDEDSFVSKPIWNRIVILFAGVAMNFFAAAIFLSIGYMIGLPAPVDDEIFMKNFARVDEAKVQIVSVLESSPANMGGIEMGDIILSIDNIKLDNVPDVQKYINDHQNDTLNFEIKRGSETFVKEVKPAFVEEADKYAIGVDLAKNALVSYPWYIAIIHGFYRTVSLAYEIVYSLINLIYQFFVTQTQSIPVAGPVGIAVLTGKASELGFVYLLQFIALLSINLGIINLLPFPALDGSKILLLFVEKIRGKSINSTVESWIHLTGFAFLMLVMLIVTYKDIVKYWRAFMSSISSLF